MKSETVGEHVAESAHLTQSQRSAARTHRPLANYVRPISCRTETKPRWTTLRGPAPRRGFELDRSDSPTTPRQLQIKEWDAPTSRMSPQDGWLHEFRWTRRWSCRRTLAGGPECPFGDADRVRNVLGRKVEKAERAPAHSACGARFRSAAQSTARYYRQSPYYRVSEPETAQTHSCQGVELADVHLRQVDGH